MWPKHAGVYADYNIINPHTCISICCLFLIRNHKGMVVNHLKLTKCDISDDVCVALMSFIMLVTKFFVFIVMKVY